jgi:hypothetical protein
MKKANPKDGRSPSELITNQIEELADWRGALLAQLRKLVLDAVPDLTELMEVGYGGVGSRRECRGRRRLQRSCQTELLQRRVFG